MFLGSHSTRVDEKGRLKLPAEFRKLLAEDQEFYITSEDGKRAILYPMAEWRLKEVALSKISSLDPDRQLYEDVTSLYGQVATMDNQGRVLIPQMLRGRGTAYPKRSGFWARAASRSLGFWRL